MASYSLGHFYIVDTTLTKPPKEKYAICVCVAARYFVWINSEARQRGRDQMHLAAGCHKLVTHDSYLDLSHVVIHQPREIETAKEFGPISKDLCRAMLHAIGAGLAIMPPRHSALIVNNLREFLAL